MSHGVAGVITGGTATTLDLFAGIPVSDYAAALPWYEQLLGGPPSFLPNDAEAVWEVAAHRYVYIVQDPGRAGNALVLSFVDDLGDRADAAPAPAPGQPRGILPGKDTRTRVAGSAGAPHSSQVKRRPVPAAIPPAEAHAKSSVLTLTKQAPGPRAGC
jgi:hypothetical protein